MNFTRRQLLFTAGALALAKRPNILMIVADDQGWGDLSVHGNANLSTPSIDSLARDGALFDRFYACPVCAPMRAEFLTGRYHARGGVRGVSTGAERLNLGELTISMLKGGAGNQRKELDKLIAWMEQQDAPEVVTLLLAAACFVLLNFFVSSFVNKLIKQ